MTMALVSPNMSNNSTIIGDGSSVTMSTASGSSTAGAGNDNSSRSVSIAYAGSSGRQQPLNNVTNLFHLGVQSFIAQLDSLFGSDESSAGSSDNNNDNNSNHRMIPCYCLPFLTCGRGEQGRATVRLIATLFFPIFLLSFFLLNDLGKGIMRTIRLRNGISRGSVTMKQYLDPAIRRKTINVFPGVKREIMWVPLERTLDLDGKISVKAAMQCPRGILFLFHGCGRFAASFFYSPQGRKMVSMAYKAGIAIVAFEKKEEKGCWEWEHDGEQVLKVGKKYIESRVLGACGTDANGDVIYPPLWAFGASSGGSFIAMLAAKMEEESEKYAPFLFSAINVQIMGPPEHVDWNIPSIFTVMEGDSITKSLVEDQVSKKFQGGPWKTIVTSGKKGIHPNHFVELYEDDMQMTRQVSNDIYQDLISLGIVDSSNGDMLKGDPRQMVDAVTSVWEKYDYVVRQAMTPDVKDILPFGVSSQLMRPLRAEELYDSNNIWLIEELNVAWDQHEITAEGFEEVISFFLEFGVPR